MSHVGKDEDSGARMQTGNPVDSLTAAENEQRVPHTPAPWRTERGVDDDDTRWIVVQDDSEFSYPYLIATIENGAPGDTLETECVNARLFAAAPEMLAALRQVDAMARDEERDGTDGVWTDEWRDMVEDARAAIAKAEGR